MTMMTTGNMPETGGGNEDQSKIDATSHLRKLKVDIQNVQKLADSTPRLTEMKKGRVEELIKHFDKALEECDRLLQDIGAQLPEK
jgi:hypothetical protein